MSFTELVERGNQLIAELKYEDAQQSFKAALSKAGSDPGRRAHALECMAGAALELGAPEAAEPLLQEAIEIDPRGSHARYLSLVQVAEPSESSVQLVETAAEILQERLAAAKDSDTAQSLTRELRSAHCTAVELLLSLSEVSQDQAQVKAYDRRADEHIAAAVKLCGTGDLETLLAEANLRLSQGRRDEAAAAMVSARDTLSRTGTGELELEVRYAAGKQFVELDMYSDAVDLLASVVEEWDGHAEAWYVLAGAHLKLDDPHAAREALDQLLACGDGAPDEMDDGILRLQQEIEERVSAEPTAEHDEMDTSTATQGAPD